MEDTTATERAMQFAFDAILPGPTEEQVRRIVYSSNWQRRFSELTRLADPDALAATVASAIARGDTPRQAAAAI